jgi:hypothetical protein
MRTYFDIKHLDTMRKHLPLLNIAVFYAWHIQPKFEVFPCEYDDEECVLQMKYPRDTLEQVEHSHHAMDLAMAYFMGVLIGAGETTAADFEA